MQVVKHEMSYGPGYHHARRGRASMQKREMDLARKIREYRRTMDEIAELLNRNSTPGGA